MKILYVTENERRVKELRDILKKSMEVETIDFLFDLDYEPQEREYIKDLEKNAYKRARQVWNKEKANYDYVIAESFGFFTEVAPNIIGIDYNDWWPGTDRDRNDALIRLFDGVKEREIYYKSVFVGFNKKGETITSEGYTYGYLGRRVKERNGKGYDSVFILKNGKYLSLQSPEEINKLSAKTIAINSLVEKLKNNS